MTVSEAVARSSTSALFSKGSIKAAQEMLLPNETVLWAQVNNVHTKPVRGELNTQMLTKDVLNGVIVVTDQRVFFVNNVLGQGVSKQIHLSSLQSVDSKYDMFFGCVRVTGLTDMIVTTCKRDAAKQLQAAIEQALADWRSRAAAAANTAPAAPALDTEQLQALKQLYDAGVLTEEEFSAKKAQILGL